MLRACHRWPSGDRAISRTSPAPRSMGRPSSSRPKERANQPPGRASGSSCQLRALILATQQVLAGQQWFMAPVRFVGADQPASRLGLAHAHHRHAGEARIVVRLDQARTALQVWPSSSDHR